MAGRFEGVSDEMWHLIEPHVYREHKAAGRPFKDFRKVINSIFWILITGARWCDLPDNPQFAKRSTAHFWLKRWTKDGTWQKLQLGLIDAADLSGKIDWDRSTIDGSFSPWPRRRGRRYDRLQRQGLADSSYG